MNVAKKLGKGGGVGLPVSVCLRMSAENERTAKQVGI